MPKAPTLILLNLYKDSVERPAGQVFLAQPVDLKDPGYMTNAMYGDCYFAIIRRWLEMGVIGRALAMNIGYPPGHERYSPPGVVELGPNFQGYVAPDMEACLGIYEPDYERDLLFIHGSSDWTPMVERHAVSRRIFYSGVSTSRWQPPWPVAAALVDDGTRTLPDARTVELFKCADEEVFRPLGLEKKWDLCVVGTFARGDKKGQAELAKKLAGKFSAVLVGEAADASQYNEVKALWPDAEFLPALPKDQVNRVLNQSRVSVIFSQENDACPRTITESLAAGTPVLLHRRNLGRKYILPGAGELTRGWFLAGTLRRMLARLDSYGPLDVYRTQFASAKVAGELWEKLGLG